MPEKKKAETKKVKKEKDIKESKQKKEKKTTKKNTETKKSSQSKNSKKKKMVVPKGEILQIDQTAPKSTIKTNESKRWAEIEQELNSGTIIDGYIEGVETEPTMLITSSYKNKKVIIPIEESGIELITEETKKKDKMWRLERAITSMLGAPIQFVLKGIDKENNIIAASRLNALYRNRAKYYGGSRPIIKKGKVVEARVIAVKERNVRFEVFGVDVVLGISELSHEWISDAREKYFVGDILPVLVEEVIFDDTKKKNTTEWYKSLQIKINAKATQEDRTIPAYEHAEVEGKYFGTVTNIKGNTYYISLANGANAIAHSFMTNPKTLRGDKVCFLCKKKEKAKYILSGIIVRTIMSDFRQ